jgi:VWFA-related protein
MRAMAAIWLLIVAVAVPLLAFQEAPQRPTFKSSTELVLIDTQVVQRDGTPIQGLAADRFEVFIEGRRRPVVSAEFIPAHQSALAGAASEASGESAAPAGRTIVLAIDQNSFPVSGQASAREAAARVVNSVAAEDHLGMVAFPGPVAIAPTRDRAAVREAVSRISGLRVDVTTSKFNISASEASQLKAKDGMATREIIGRECRFDPYNNTCPQEVIQDGGRIADALEHQAVQSLSGLHGVIEAVGSLPGRKTLILISAGLPMHPRGTPNPDSETTSIARRAAAANINLYVFYMNVHFLRAFSAEYGKRNNSLFEDITLFGYGLEKFADSAGGSFFQIEVDSDPFVARALRETSAAYILAVQVQPEDRDGKDHFIRVSVKQRGATARYRRVVNIPAVR